MQPASFLEMLREKGTKDERILQAFAKVDRKRFLPEEQRDAAYDDVPLPIGGGQTTSQPSLIAYMLERLDLEQHHRVLEIGTGCGYVVALLACLCDHVVGAEKRKELVVQARRNLAGIVLPGEFEIVHTPDQLGAHGKGPYDRILVSAAAEEIPPELAAQLKERGLMVIPMGDGPAQRLYEVRMKGDKATPKELIFVQFVPLV